jgi:protein ImuB
MPQDETGAGASQPSSQLALYDSDSDSGTGADARPGVDTAAGHRKRSERPARYDLARRSRPSDVAAAEPRSLWMCVHLPHCALETSARTVADDTPLVIVDGVGSRGQVIDANTAASRAGIRAGMGLNAAYALAPWLLAIAHQPQRIETALDRLAGWTMQFTSVTSPCPPDALLLEIGGSLKLFGGCDDLAALVQEGLARLGYTAVLAAAPTPLAALWRARGGQCTAVLHRRELAASLAALPLDCLRWPAQQVERMHGMGIRCVGDCLRLPRDGFARRFGKVRLAELDRALGRLADPVAPWQAPLQFSSELELPAPMQAVSLLEIAFGRLLDELDVFLMTRQAQVRHLDVLMRLENRRTQRLVLRLAAAVSDGHYLMELLRERLDQERLQAPVIAVGIEATQLHQRQAGSGDLFERTPRAGEDAQRLLERLRTRLGQHNVHGITRVADHRPEAAWDSVEPGASRPDAPLPRQRPLWMFEQPRRLSTEKSGRPRYRRRPVVFVQGPERIESGWWDGGDVRRDYYVARGSDGERLWLYQERRSGGWYLHGIFA